MAVYGRDFYGLAKYGAAVYVEYDVQPFTAEPVDYGKNRIRWNMPSGTYSSLRLIRSRQGFSANVNDGDVLLDTTNPTSEFIEADVSPGVWYYYSLYLLVAGSWVRAGTVSCLSVSDYGTKDLLNELIPRYYRYTRRIHSAITDQYVILADEDMANVFDPDQYDRVNQHLVSFLDVLGWGFDLLKTYHETTLQVHDPYVIHPENLERLAHMLGTSYEVAVPQRVMRNKVANASLISRSRATLEGLRDEVALSTGYDVDLSVGPNLMLDVDQSSFVHPNYPEYSEHVNYAAGQRVKYTDRIYEAKVGGAYGWDQRPETVSPYENTWWDNVASVDVETLRAPKTNGISTWKNYEWDGMHTVPTNEAAGITNSVSGEGEASNALRVVNNTGAMTEIIAVSAANISNSQAQPAPLSAIQHGVPIPGDKQPRMAISYYQHGFPFIGTTGEGALAMRSYVYCHDERGRFLARLGIGTSRGFIYDTFDTESVNWNGRAPEYKIGSTNWVLRTGNFTVSDGKAYPLNMTKSTLTINIPDDRNRFRVACTFTGSPPPGKEQALVIRFVDANNLIRITRTKVERLTAGTPTTLATLTTPIKDGERVTAIINDTTGLMSVAVSEEMGETFLSGPGVYRVTNLNIGTRSGSTHNHGIMLF